MGNGADSELDILIRLLAQTQGADQVQAALNKTKDATTDASKATEGLNEKTGEGAKEAEKFELNHRAVHKILHLIARESGPEMGAALATATAVGVGGVGLWIMALKELVEWIHKAGEKSREAREEAASAQIAVWEAQRTAMVDAKKAADEYYASITNIQSVAGQIQQADESRKTVIEAEIKAIEKLLEFQERQALIAAQGNKAEEERIKKLYGEKREDADTAGEAAKIAELQREKATVDNNLILAKQRADAAAAAHQAEIQNVEESTRADAEANSIKNKIGSGETARLNELFQLVGLGEGATLEAAKERLKDLKKEADNASGDPITTGGTTIFPREIAQQRYEAAKNQIEQLERTEEKLKELAKVTAEHNASLDKLKAASDAATSDFKKLSDRSKSLAEQIATAESVYKVNADEARAEGKNPPSIRPYGAKTGPAPLSVEQVQSNLLKQEDAAYNILRSGGSLDATQTRLMQEILRQQTGHVVAANKILQVMREFYERQDAFEAGLTRQLKDLQHSRDQSGY